MIYNFIRKTIYSEVAHAVEQVTVNHLVAGSISHGAIFKNILLTTVKLLSYLYQLFDSHMNFALLAQLVEQLICNHQVVGSIPTEGSILRRVGRVADGSLENY